VIRNEDGVQTNTWVEEKRRIASRRKLLEIPKGPDEASFGLALSGGGIRSATFSLGVLQALAQARLPANAAYSAIVSADNTAKPKSWLQYFDYVSTVSGGGYVGAFFVSLFVPKRLMPDDPKPAERMTARIKSFAKRMLNKVVKLFGFGDEPPTPVFEKSPGGATAATLDAARQAYEVLSFDPPGRIRSGEQFDPIRKPLAWLRENGRYLTPTGGGDFIYAAALGLRNWCSLHYVIGTIVFTLTAGLVALKSAAARHSCGETGCEGFFGLKAWPMPTDMGQWQIWWSPFWVLPIVTVLTWVLPSGLAYWLSSQQKQVTGKVGMLRRFFASAVLAFNAVITASLVWLLFNIEASGPLKWLIGAAAAVTSLAMVFHGAAVASSYSVPQQRVNLTRALARGLIVTLVMVGLAALDSASQTFYLWFKWDGSPLRTVLTPASILAALVWLIRRMAFTLTERATPKWLDFVPLNLAAGVLAALLLFAIATAWGVLVQWIVWQGEVPYELSSAGFSEQFNLAWKLALVGLGLSLVNGRFPEFINMSTLHQFYSSRLTRAYLGASNGARFKESDGPQASSPGQAKWSSVAEPHPNDDISRTDYFSENVGAPIHLINVTMNQTVDPAEQLIQRDRKGKCLTIGPTGYFLDGQHQPFNKDVADVTVGQWVGLSGAAFTTGLGRTSSLGVSMLLGLANVRLGMWWKSDFGEDRSSAFAKWALRLFPTQTYLFYEFTARFHGNHRRRHYLSDGGHFENTAAYELLRPERDIKLIVALDNGCDAKYEFSDLANLVRLVRIDFGAQVERVTKFGTHKGLRKIFGHDSEFHDLNPGEGATCAMLFKVTYSDQGAEQEREVAARTGAAQDEAAYKEMMRKTKWLVVLKPRLIEGAPADVVQYHRAHPEFPQQSTFDQFFDEAQWESYRRLGLEIGRLVFDVHGGPLCDLVFGEHEIRAGHAVVRVTQKFA